MKAVDRDGRWRSVPVRAVCFLAFAAFGGAPVASRTVEATGMKPGEVAVIRVAARKAGLLDFRLFSRTGPSGRLIVEGFNARLGGGRLTGSGQVDFANPAGPHRMRVELSGVDGTAFLRLLEVKLDATVQAKVDGQFDLQWRGTTGPQARRTLSGTARWTAGRGGVSGADVMVKAAQLTGIAQLSGFEISSAGARGVFREGVLSVESLRVSGPEQEVTGTGQLNVATRDVRMTLMMRVSPELLSSSALPEVRALGFLASGMRNAAEGNGPPDRLVSLPIPLKMTGKVQDPQFQFGDAGTPGTNAVRQPRPRVPATNRK